MSTYPDEVEEIQGLLIADGQQRLKAGSDLREVLHSIAFKQHALASSFLNVGNEHVAAQLFRWSRELSAVADKWSKIEGTDLTDRLNQSQQFSDTVLEAALAGLTLGTKGRDAPIRKGDPDDGPPVPP